MITFTKEDAQGIQFPHTNAFVVILNIINYDIRHILIDNRSSVDVLFCDAFLKMKILDDRLGKINFLFIRFTEDTIPIKGVITLPVKADRFSIQSTVQVDFLIVRAPSTYNTILDWLGLNASELSSPHTT